jgi:flavin-dependent dehydrogenase
MDILDLVIVGGGPAGASAGYAAGIQGIPTITLERAIFHDIQKKIIYSQGQPLTFSGQRQST